jgi:hypothetical protein
MIDEQNTSELVLSNEAENLLYSPSENLQKIYQL